MKLLLVAECKNGAGCTGCVVDPENVDGQLVHMFETVTLKSIIEDIVFSNNVYVEEYKNINFNKPLAENRECSCSPQADGCGE